MTVLQLNLSGEAVLGEKLSIRAALKQYLWQGLLGLTAQHSLDVALTIDWPDGRSLPVHPERGSTFGIYTSAIAQPLARRCQVSPLALAKTLSQHLPHQLTETPLTQACPITLTINEAGWLQFILSDQAIAHWLNHLWVFLNQPITSSLVESQQFPGINALSKQTQSQLILCQYAHARGCSLLRLGHQAKLIEWSSGWRSPLPMPWLVAPSDESDMHLQHPAVQQLLAQLQSLGEWVEQELVTQDTFQNTLDLAVNVSQAFLQFDAQCRIFGEVQRDRLNLPQSRLALVAITQLSLEFWLRTLNFPAPTQL